jgi:hypothetical protein
MISIIKLVVGTGHRATIITKIKQKLLILIAPHILGINGVF